MSSNEKTLPVQLSVSLIKQLQEQMKWSGCLTLEEMIQTSIDTLQDPQMECEDYMGIRQKMIDTETSMAL